MKIIPATKEKPYQYIVMEEGDFVVKHEVILPKIGAEISFWETNLEFAKTKQTDKILLSGNPLCKLSAALFDELVTDQDLRQRFDCKGSTAFIDCNFCPAGVIGTNCEDNKAYGRLYVMLRKNKLELNKTDDEYKEIEIACQVMIDQLLALEETIQKGRSAKNEQESK